MRCSQCGKDHDLLEPSFRRPDIVFALPPEERRRRIVRDSDDLCVLSGEDGNRWFVRCILPIPVHEYPDGTAWGFWAEVSERDFATIEKNWTTEDQSRLGPFDATIANETKTLPGTMGLKVLLKPTGPKTRPVLRFAEGSSHQLAVYAESGVPLHVATVWGQR